MTIAQVRPLFVTPEARLTLSVRMYGELEPLKNDQVVFLCHSSSDKGMVRMVNDDLKNLGLNPWLDENVIKVGDSIVGKISAGLETSSVMIAYQVRGLHRKLPRWVTRNPF